MTSAVVLGKAGWLNDEGIKLAEGWWVVDNEMQGLRCVVGVVLQPFSSLLLLDVVVRLKCYPLVYNMLFS